ncbi:uncharacterized protein LOC130427264 isoform X2 [Triplophysa dalaica]|uniref:uncharacterized protein LOC130427264 isoform X2 n=1 Tax=Triplophysa dalaica TaxID=1582913 RepID=UPI0024DFCB95|nr:uncharacterized protein LOC130427264 isoform X2 [Triplophysa dalaica]
MKDVVLSLLSRGFGQIVPGESCHNGRLEVCYEPEDYFNWKSQPPLLRLTGSGLFLGGTEPVPPKTYSTRRGPLILYSEDIALSYQACQVNRKRKALTGPKQEVEYHLHTLQDLTGAILAYGKKQSKAGSLADVAHPFIPDTKPASQHIHEHHTTGEKCYHLSHSKGKGGQVPYQPHFLCSPRPRRATLGPLPPITTGLVHVQSQETTHLDSAETDGQIRHKQHFFCSPRPNRARPEPLPPITKGLLHIKSQEKTYEEPEEQMSLKTKGQQKPKVKITQSVRTEADTFRAPMSPIPETTVAQTELLDLTIVPDFIDHTRDLNGSKKLSLVENKSDVGEMCTLRSVNVDSSLESCPLSRLNYYGGHMEGFRQIRHCGGETQVRRVTADTDPSLTIYHLPPIETNPMVNSASDFSTLTMNKPKTITRGSCETPPQRELKVHLPDVTLETTHVKNTDRSVRSKVLVLLPPQTVMTEIPALADELCETLIENSKPCGDKELTEEAPQKRQDPSSNSKCRIIEMDLGRVVRSDAPEKRGPLPPLMGRRGPGKQSSMAVFSQSVQDPADAEEAQTGNIRGCLPPELRERLASEAAGTLIMGPDGEIIRLSHWDPAVHTEDNPLMNDLTQGQVLKVVTSEEDVAQPWMILIQDCTEDKGDVITHNTEATTTNKEQLDSRQEVFMANKHTVQPNAKRGKNHLRSHTETVKTQMFTKTNAEEVEEEEQEDEENDEELGFLEEEGDYLGFHNEISEKAQWILVYAHAKQNNEEDNENLFGSDSEILQEAQVFNVSSRVMHTNAKRKKKHLGSDTEIIQEAQVIKVNSHTKHVNKKTNEDYLGSGDHIIQDEQVCLPEDEHRLSTTPQPGIRGEWTTAVKKNRKGKTTTLQQETGVTLGLRKSKGAVSVINPKSTQFPPTTDTPKQSLSPKSKRKTDEIQKDDTKYRVFEDNTATSKQYTFNLQKKKKTKEMAETTEPQNTKVKTKKKIKGQSSFIVGKPRAQEVEWNANWMEESERQTPETYERETYEESYVAHKREVLSHNTDDDDVELDKSVSQEQNYTDSEGDMDADTDSVSIEAHEAQDSPRSVYTAQRSHYSQFSVRSHPSTHQLPQSSHRTTSVGMVAQCGPCSPAPLSAQHPATDPIKSQSGNNVKTSEEQKSKKQVDTKATALSERAERRRLEVERKRKEKDEEKSRQQEKEATEERVRMELEEEQNNRAEEARIRKIKEVEEKQRRQKEAMERQRREQAEKERERRRQEEKKRLVERLQKERLDEEKRHAAELERKRLEEKAWEEEEQKKLLEMEEAERLGYLLRRKEEEVERRKAVEERKRRNEEAAMRAEEEAILQADLFARQRAAQEQHLKFNRGLFVEAGGLDQTQDISRPWIFSYFALLKMLGLDHTSAHEDALTDKL